MYGVKRDNKTRGKTLCSSYDTVFKACRLHDLNYIFLCGAVRSTHTTNLTFVGSLVRKKELVNEYSIEKTRRYQIFHDQISRYVIGFHFYVTFWVIKIFFLHFISMLKFFFHSSSLLFSFHFYFSTSTHHFYVFLIASFYPGMILSTILVSSL